MNTIKLPYAYANHPIVINYSDLPIFINFEKLGQHKIPKTLWTPTSKDEMHTRPHLVPIDSQHLTKGITFHEAYKITKQFTPVGIGTIFVGTPLVCIDGDIKNIADPAEREKVRVELLGLFESFNTFVEQSMSGGFHAWFLVTTKDGLLPYIKIPIRHIEVFVNQNYVTLGRDPITRNGKPLRSITPAELIQLFPEVAELNPINGRPLIAHTPQPTGGISDSWKQYSHLGITADWNIDPTQSDEEVCRAAAADPIYGYKFIELYNERFQQFNPNWSYSEADQSFVNILAMFTDSRFQVVRVWNGSLLGKRLNAPEGTDKNKLKRNPKYVIRTVNKAFDAKHQTRIQPAAEQYSITNQFSPSVNPFIFKKASEYEMQNVEWLWKNYLARRKMTILAGMPGTGKSMITDAMIATITNGGQWPDRSGNGTNGYCLIYSTEEDDMEDTTVPRLKAAGADMDKVLVLAGKRDYKGNALAFDPATDFEYLLQYVRQYKEGIDLLVIDPLIRIVNGNPREANKVRHALHTINELSRHLNCSAVGNTHFAKNSRDRHILDRVLESGAFVQVARIVLNTVCVHNTPEHLMIRSKVSNGIAKGGMSYSIETAEVQDKSGKEVETSCIHWNGEIKGDPNELIAKAEGTLKEVDTQVGKARTFLIDMLKDGPKDKEVIEQRAREAGISDTSLQRAKKELPIAVNNEGFPRRTTWRLSLNMT